MAFTYPGGSGADDLGDLNDVDLSTLVNNDVLQYDGTKWVNTQLPLDELSDVTLTSNKISQSLLYNGTAWVNGDSRNESPAQYPIGTGRFYFPYGIRVNNNNYPEQGTFASIKFGNTVTISKWAFAYNGNGTTAAGNTGVEVRGYIYAPGSTGRPHTLVKDLGSTTVVASDAVGGATDAVVQITLGSTVDLTANTQYFVGMLVYPVDQPNHTYNASPQILFDSQEIGNPYWEGGINPVLFSNGSFSFRRGGYYNGSVNLSTFDLINDSLPNNIENQVGTANSGARIGLNVSAIS